MPRRPDLPCSQCGELMWRGTTSAYAGQATCRPCRRARPGYRDRALKAASRGVERWDCARCGASCERLAVKGQRPKWCVACRKLGGAWIAKPIRLAIYERDSWLCGICGDSVDEGLIGSRSIWRPSLDHITPSSRGGSDDPWNLRLAHFWCNSVRCDERTYTEEDFRGANVAA